MVGDFILVKRKPKELVCRIHDEVVIVNPLVVRRIGYPLSLTEGREHVEKLYGNEIASIFRRVTGRVPDQFDERNTLGPLFGNSPSYDNILKEFAYAYIRAKSFGGPERTIHTELVEKLRGIRCRVSGKRMVKTGTYRPAAGGQDYWGDYEYEPAYLKNEKTHVLLELSPINLEDLIALGQYLTFEIEECNVKRFVEGPVANEDLPPW